MTEAQEAEYMFREFNLDSSEETHDELTDTALVQELESLRAGSVLEVEEQEDLLEELDGRREASGMVVALLWNKMDRVLQIHAKNEITGAEFTFPVDKEHARDALEHPSSYAAKAGWPTHQFFSKNIFEEAA